MSTFPPTVRAPSNPIGTFKILPGDTELWRDATQARWDLWDAYGARVQASARRISTDGTAIYQLHPASLIDARDRDELRAWEGAEKLHPYPERTDARLYDPLAPGGSAARDSYDEALRESVRARVERARELVLSVSAGSALTGPVPPPPVFTPPPIPVDLPVELPAPPPPTPFTTAPAIPPLSTPMAAALSATERRTFALLVLAAVARRQRRR